MKKTFLWLMCASFSFFSVDMTEDVFWVGAESFCCCRIWMRVEGRKQEGRKGTQRRRWCWFDVKSAFVYSSLVGSTHSTLYYGSNIFYSILWYRRVGKKVNFFRFSYIYVVNSHNKVKSEIPTKSLHIFHSSVTLNSFDCCVSRMTFPPRRFIQLFSCCSTLFNAIEIFCFACWGKSSSLSLFSIEFVEGKIIFPVGWRGREERERQICKLKSQPICMCVERLEALRLYYERIRRICKKSQRKSKS